MRTFWARVTGAFISVVFTAATFGGEARLTATLKSAEHLDGNIDLSFRPASTLTNSFIPLLAVDGEGKPVGALVEFQSDPENMVIRRFNIDGSVDTNFTASSMRGVPTALAVQDDGKILIASELPFNFDCARLNADGSSDTSFNFTANSKVTAAIQLPGGKILIAGAFNTLYGFAADRVARLNANGSIDHTFQSFAFVGRASVDYGTPRCLAVQADGKIVVGLQIHSCGCGDAPRLAILRLNANGSYDSTFDTSEFLPSYVNCLAVQPDGKILAGGFQFTQTNLNAIVRHGLLRLNTNGAIDATFTTPLLIGSDVHAVARSGRENCCELQLKRDAAECEWLS